LQELDTDAAVSLAQKIAMRRAVQNATGAPKPPGTRLHVLTIGITKYGANAENFNLKYADRDAHDLVDTLLRTQSGGPYGGGMYADVKPTYMPDGIAKKRAILEALYAMANTMNPDDFAVVMFAGHGAMVGGEFYLLPHDVDVSTPVGFTESTISAKSLHAAVAKLAEKGHVLVLLDACHAGAYTDDSKSPPNADVLRLSIAANSTGNVSVLTSSSAHQVSREDDDWKHGAFTKVVLDGLSGSDRSIDINNDNAISMGELTEYLHRNLSRLTNGAQQLGVTTRFVGKLFVAGF
jgi:Caspase domain